MHLLLLALFSSVLLIFSFPGSSLSFLAWTGLIPYFFVLQEAKNQKQLFFYSFLSGFVFYLGLIYWLLFVPSWTKGTLLTSFSVLAGYIFLCAVLGLFFYFAAFICVRLRRERNISFIWSAPVVWAAQEYIKTVLFTGFPWGLVGVSQYSFLPLIQISGWTGIYGVSFCVVLANAWLFEILSSMMGMRRALNFKEAAFPILILVAVLFYGFSFFYVPVTYNPLKEMGIQSETNVDKANAEQETEEGYKISLIQGNIPQDVKWSQEYEDYIHDEYKRLTIEEIERGKPELVIWPETAIPSYLRFDDKGLKLLAGLLNKYNIPFLVGASDARQVLEKKNEELIPVAHYFNSAFWVEPKKGITQQYDKIHLVPFGEYMPWWISFMKSLSPNPDAYSSEHQYTVFKAKYPFSVVICYEDIFPCLVRRFVNNGATWLVNMTNDGWFKNSSAPMQHAIHAVFRCVENNVWMVRCTNTGVSCFISPKGEIVSQIENEEGKNIWLSGSLTDKVYPIKRKTFYTRFGDVFSWLMILTVLLMFIIRKKK